MATSAKKVVVKKAVTATKSAIAVQASTLKKTTQKPEKSLKPAAAKKHAAPAVKTVLSPSAAWPFPTGPRP